MILDTRATPIHLEVNSRGREIGRDADLRRRSLGRYDTPRPLSQAIAGWAIRSPNDTVLEPSTGSGVFVRSALYRLRELLQAAPQKQVWACDIDETACAQTIESARLPAAHVFHGDFFHLLQEPFFKSHRFDCIIGNPPYVSLHRMDAAQRLSARRAIDMLGLKLDRKASLWAYFLAVGVELINPCGRLAFIIPEISLHADYARGLLPLIAKNFQKCFAISLRERCFTSDGAEERIVLLLGDNAQSNSAGEVIIHECDTVHQLEGFLRNIISDNSDAFPRMNGHIVSHLLQAPRKSPLDLKTLPHSCKLGSLADVKIGVVTGANKFFLLTEKERRTNGIPLSAVLPLIPDFKACHGISFSKWDWNELFDNDDKCWLLSPKPNERRVGMLRYLKQWKTGDIEHNKTFQKREPWYIPQLGRQPDAFLRYMGAYAPRASMTTKGITCTNTVHRLYFKNPISLLARRVVVLSLHSSISRLSSEFEGRAYGSGVLKLEPSEARQLAVIVPPKIAIKKFDKCFREVDEALRLGAPDKATDLVDNWLCNEISGLSKMVSFPQIQELAKTASVRRVGKR